MPLIPDADRWRGEIWILEVTSGKTTTIKYLWPGSYPPRVRATVLQPKPGTSGMKHQASHLPDPCGLRRTHDCR